MDTPLGPEELNSAVARLPRWKIEGDALVRTFEFAGFGAAFAFMTRVAFEAEAMQHHPEWTNVYDTVAIRLTTHHVGDRITRKDVELATRIQNVAREAVPSQG